MPKQKPTGDAPHPMLPFPTANGEHLDIAKLETWLWDAACVIRGAMDAPKFKDFILPLIFYKRLSDVFDDEFAKLSDQFGGAADAQAMIEADHTSALKTDRNPMVRFYVPQEYNWDALRDHPANGGLGQFVTDALREIARLNPRLKGVLDVEDFNKTQSGQRFIDDERLEKLIAVISQHRLGLDDAEPDILGRAYEYLLRKFAEGQGQSAGEYYTPKEVGWLMAGLLRPEPYSTIYDPTCGSGGLLIKARLWFEQTHPAEKSQAPQIYGQELTPTTYAMAKMNAFLHDFIGADIQIGDTFRNPCFVEARASVRRFDYVVANPMWNQEGYAADFYENDPYNRFSYGTPVASTADWGWVQHIHASLNERGRAAIVLDTGAVSRGSGSQQTDRERAIRQKLVEADLIEGVILLPENLFYNTNAPGIILLLNRNKPESRKEQMLLMNLSKHFEKGKPKNILTDSAIETAASVYQAWETREKLSRVITLADAAKTDYNLSPAQFVDVGDKVSYRPVNEILADLTEARIAREKADNTLEDVLAQIKL